MHAAIIIQHSGNPPFCLFPDSEKEAIVDPCFSHDVRSTLRQREQSNWRTQTLLFHPFQTGLFHSIAPLLDLFA